MASDPRAISAEVAVTMGIVTDGHTSKRQRKPILRAPEGARLRLEMLRFERWLLGRGGVA